MARLSRVALMGELTASLAHELNQPLTAIASNAAAGKRILAQGSPDPEMFENCWPMSSPMRGEREASFTESMIWFAKPREHGAV